MHLEPPCEVSYTYPMKRFLLMLVVFLPFGVAIAESDFPNLNPAWRSCVHDDDCVIIHVNGCPFDSIPISRSHREEAREWARRENMRHNCAREGVSEELKKKMRAACVERVCVFAPLLVD